jgi:hypothetical protein
MGGQAGGTVVSTGWSFDFITVQQDVLGSHEVLVTAPRRVEPPANPQSCRHLHERIAALCWCSVRDRLPGAVSFRRLAR